MLLLPAKILDFMIAIVKVAGQQFTVEQDKTLFVPRISGNAGDKISLEVLMAEANGALSFGTNSTTKVEAEIVDHVKGDTVIAFKKKRRKGFRKVRGHRTAYTKIKVVSIA